MSIEIYRMPDRVSVFSNGRYADSFMKRFRGLLGRTSIESQEALVFSKCNCVHTLGMKTDIDVVFLDDQMRIVKLAHKLKPNRVSGSIRAKTVVEVKPGICKEKALCVNDVLHFENRK